MIRLHSHGIIHCDINTYSILFDDFLFLEYWMILEVFNQHDESTLELISANFQSKNAIFASYLVPEVLIPEHYTKSDDCYSFPLIFIEKITNEILYKNIDDAFQIIHEIAAKGNRPEFNK